MADDRGDRRDEEEFKIVVRDRRRVTTEGELREVEEPTPTPATPPPAATPPPPPPASEEAPPRERARRGSGGLQGAERARAKRGGPLREVSDEDLPAAPEEEAPPADGEAPRIANIYEYAELLASQLCVWSLASLGLMPHPATGIVTVDMDQASFGIDAAEAIIDTLIERDKLEPEALLDLYRSLVAQFGSVAAQLLNQPAQVRLQEIRKIRFCIDTADRFAQSVSSLVEHAGVPGAEAQVAELSRFLNELRLAYVQASGGGGIVG